MAWIKTKSRAPNVPVALPVQRGENASPTETAAAVQQNAKALSVVNTSIGTMIKRNDIVWFTHPLPAAAKARKDARTAQTTDESNKIKIRMYMQN